MTSEKDPNIGRLIADRYLLHELVGKGAMGQVYRAEDVLLGSFIAVKLLVVSLADRMRDRFKAEARICAQLGQGSLHIVRVSDYGLSEENIPFYVMEYLQGQSLNDIISMQPLPLPRFLNLARQICLGLQCAHKGILIDGQLCPIIHRDIKPSNILVIESGFGELVKVLDFGIAKLLQEDSGQTNSFMGTLPYSSPEQMEGQDLDPRSDIYSLGIMMFEMLTGKMPLHVDTHSFGSWYKAHHFQAPRSFETVNPALKLPKVLEALVMSCLEKNPSQRPQAMTEILKTLDPLAERYSPNQEVSNRIGEVLARTGQTEEFKTLPSETLIEQIYRSATWPPGKPIAQIVFPQVHSFRNQKVMTIWVMLPEAEIRSLQINRFYNRLYKNCFCTMSPHPMVLWITGIYNRFHSKESGPRFLTCFLDLKSPPGGSMAQLLAANRDFQILLFALGKPDRCAHVINVPLQTALCSNLQQWAIQAKPLPIGDAAASKNMLRAEFERQKPDIIQKLARSDEFPSWQ